MSSDVNYFAEKLHVFVCSVLLLTGLLVTLGRFTFSFCGNCKGCAFERKMDCNEAVKLKFWVLNAEENKLNRIVLKFNFPTPSLVKNLSAIYHLKNNKIILWNKSKFPKQLVHQKGIISRNPIKCFQQLLSIQFSLFSINFCP